MMSNSKALGWLLALFGGAVGVYLLIKYFNPLCPSCGRVIQRGVWKCPHCGVGLRWD